MVKTTASRSAIRFFRAKRRIGPEFTEIEIGTRLLNNQYGGRVGVR
jgi:hypothetical protein